MARTPTASRYDVVVAGARCAGAAVAMLLARIGMSVLVVDRGRHGSDTLSTHALMRGAVVQLHRWGVLPAVVVAGTPPVHETTFHYGTEALTIPITARGGVDALYAPRRYLLDRLLADAAANAGADFFYGARVVDLLRRPDGRPAGVVVIDPDGPPRSITAEFVIGADGLRSTVGRMAGAQVYRQGEHAAGVAYGYWQDVAGLDGYHWYWADGCAAGAIQTNDRDTCVFVSVPAHRFHELFDGGVEAGYRRVLTAAFPELCVRLPPGPLALQAFSGQRGFIRESWGPGWALVGDAACFKDPITAHGITDALRDAELLARAVADGTDRAFASYQRMRDELVLDVFDLSDRIASYTWNLDSVQVLHEALAKAMANEVKAIGAFGARPFAG
jgi:2-polyprenyl-6-methoxyphenol hydroxylase-like FAD-dependent oxidoreductase